MGDRFQAMTRTGSGGGGGICNCYLREQQFTPTNGQTEFALDYTPVGSVAVFVGPLTGIYGFHYTVAGTTVQWLDIPWALDSGDTLTAIYLSGTT